MERGCPGLQADIVKFKEKSGRRGAGAKTQTKPNPSQGRRVSYNTVSKK